MQKTFLGIDVGSSHTRALLSDGRGRAIGMGVAGPGNPKCVGYDGMAEAIQIAARRATAGLDLGAPDITALGVGAAGYDWPAQHGLVLQACRAPGWATVPVRIVNDTILALIAGAPRGWGIALVAGTHCNCRGWDSAGREGRAVGSPRLGERAGAVELIDQAVCAVAAHWSRRGPPTALSQALVAMTGASGVDELIEGLEVRRYHLGPEAAPVVFAAAARGDEVARGLVDWAGGELGSLARGVIRQLQLQTEAFDVVLAGGLFYANRQLARSVARVVRTEAPRARFVRLRLPPAVGGVLLAMDIGGINAALCRQALLQSTGRLLRRGCPRGSFTVLE